MPWIWLLGVMLVWGSAAANATVLRVAPGKLTISQALDTAESGTVIMIAPGIYSERTGENFPLLIPIGVTLQGEVTQNGERVIIQGSGKFFSSTGKSEDVTIVLGKNTKISGLTITNSQGYGVWIEGTNPLVVGNTFTGSAVAGMVISGNSQAQILNNYFYKNQATGLILLDLAYPLVKGNTFQDLNLGLNIDSHSVPTIQNNIIRYCLNGVVITGQAQPVFRDNQFIETKSYAIILREQARPDFGTVNNLGGNSFSGSKTPYFNNLSSNQIVAFGNQTNRNTTSSHTAIVGTKATKIAPKSSASDPVSSFSSVSLPNTELKLLIYAVYVKHAQVSQLISLFPNAMVSTYQGEQVIRVGSFRYQENAQNLKLKLQQSGFDIIIVQLPKPLPKSSS